MTNLVETAQWEPGVYQLETSDPVMGGPDGIDNVQARQLGNRTRYLKEHFEDHTAAANPHPQYATLVQMQTAINALVAAETGQNINVGRVNLDAFNLTPGDNAIVISDGISWTVLGSMQLAQSYLFNSSLAGSGYQKLPSGLIVQWGTGSATANNTYPIAFPNGPLSVVATVAAATTGTPYYVNVNLNGGKTSFGANAFSGTTSLSGVAIHWLAIGV